MMYEIYNERLQTTEIEVKDGVVEAIDSSVSHGKAVRVIKDGGLGFAYSTDVNIPEQEVVDMAATIAECVSPDLDLTLPPQSPAPAFSRNLGLLSNTSVSDKIELAKALEANVLAYDKRIKAVRKSGYGEFIKDVSILNSNGVDVQYSTGLCALSIMAVAEDGSESERAGEIEYSFDPGKFDVEEIAKTVARKAIQRLNSRKIASCRAPCILERSVAAEMLGIAITAFFADSVYKEKSPFANKTGEEIYSPKLTIIDDATLPHGFSSVPCDAEGVPAKKVEIIKDGVLSSFLADTYYAKKIKSQPTGSSVRSSVMMTPKIGVNNLFLKSGDKDLKKDGAEGFWIDNGEDQFGVKGITIAGNIHQLLKRVVAVGNDIKFWKSLGSPSILIEEIAISGN
ncbi:MAG: TldD/PmbA family protein [Deltaproteobacteria bacterium]|nr:TldD/PmbA family protein [Deltaproteobacteria bacterium]